MRQNSAVEHNSQDQYYRCPLGAVEAGTAIRLRLRLNIREAVEKVIVRTWWRGVGEKLFELQIPEKKLGEECVYSAQLTAPGEGCLFWYYFIVVTGSRTLYYGNAPDHLGGFGVCSDTVPASFQITVYDVGAKTPDWFKHTVMYQIFPDRFCRKGSAMVEKTGAVYHASWMDSPFYYKDVDTREIVAYDFFGGNLAGIQQKLSYLKELGISVVYLNPIFESESNHRYDTGDYHKVDPILGSNEDLQALCAEGEKQGIRFILDGVFSHTGSNSIYFNRAGQYKSVGAFQSKDSPYYEWYNFRKHPYEYESWWGFSTLPDVKETTPSYMKFIIHEPQSVLHHWMRQGISGWRLDVVDELPADFAQAFYKELKHVNPEAVLIGEVWEDASNKVSYSVQREYLCGHEIDSAMNYPFRQYVLDFLLQRTDASACARCLLSLQENYPAQNFYAMMNLLGSHDVERLLTVLGEAPFYEGMPAIHQAQYRLDNDHYNLAMARLRIAVLWQMTYPGVPCVYYGDEIGMQGFKDPFNRAPYDWEHGDSYILAWYKKTIAKRNAHMALQTGELLMLCSQGDVYAYARVIRGGRDVFGETAKNELFLVVLNRSTQERMVSLDVRDLSAGRFREAFGNAPEAEVFRGQLTVKVPALGALLFEELPLTRQYAREAGILLHPTSLATKYGIGDIGAAAREFVDYLAAAGQSIWQILPLNPVGFGYSPYQSPSAFAGNPMLLSLDELAAVHLLEPAELKLEFVDQGDLVDYEYAWNFKRKCLKRAWQRFQKKAELQKGFQDFCQKQSFWLDDYALFCALQQEQPQSVWMDWPEPIRRRDPRTIEALKLSMKDSVGFVKFLQYLFFQQWDALHAYAGKKGIRILGDMPIFIAQDSADVWAHQQLFKLGGDGRALKVAGVPPDYFSATGQLWGNPQYDWQAMKAENYAWWKQRFTQLFRQVDIVRIDHFRGFESYWEVDSGEKTAIKGEWMPGPGRDFFVEIERELGHMPIVAEDLGIITDGVEALRAACGYPGMKVLQFELFFNEQHRMGFAAPENSIIYTGTHDNNTTVGWYTGDIDDADADAIAAMLRADAGDAPQICRHLVEFAYASNARMAIVPMQDVLQKDSRCRMNMPGTVGRSWKWRLRPGMLRKEDAAWLKELCVKYQR